MSVNLHHRKPDDLAAQLESEEKQCLICIFYKTIIIGSMQRYCEKGRQWPKVGTCRAREVIPVLEKEE